MKVSAPKYQHLQNVVLSRGLFILFCHIWNQLVSRSKLLHCNTSFVTIVDFSPEFMMELWSARFESVRISLTLAKNSARKLRAHFWSNVTCGSSDSVRENISSKAFKYSESVSIYSCTIVSNSGNLQAFLIFAANFMNSATFIASSEPESYRCECVAGKYAILRYIKHFDWWWRGEPNGWWVFWWLAEDCELIVSILGRLMEILSQGICDSREVMDENDSLISGSRSSWKSTVSTTRKLSPDRCKWATYHVEDGTRFCFVTGTVTAWKVRMDVASIFFWGWRRFSHHLQPRSKFRISDNVRKS